MFLCDFCRKETSTDYKIACEKCYNLLLYLLTEFEKAKGKKIVHKKAGKKKKKKREEFIIPQKKELPKKKTAREIRFEKSSKELNPTDLLTKCATCDFSFIDGATKKISCAEGKDPKTCGQ